jgi:hypothetical protein
VLIERREGCEATCEVKHGGTTLFRGSDGSASRSNLLLTFREAQRVAERRIGEVVRTDEVWRLRRDLANARAQRERSEVLREQAERERNEAREERDAARHEVQSARLSLQIAVNRENERGGEARQVVLTTARILDIELAEEPLGGEMWSPKNMQRVQRAARSLVQENNDLRRIVGRRS